jgi:hypothetical protein
MNQSIQYHIFRGGEGDFFQIIGQSSIPCDNLETYRHGYIVIKSYKCPEDDEHTLWLRGSMPDRHLKCAIIWHSTAQDIDASLSEWQARATWPPVNTSQL